MHFLMIDDDIHVSGVVRAALEQAGHKVDICGTAADAHDALRHHAYDLALIDFFLPDGTGLDLLEFVRSTQPDLPVVMLSSRLNMEARPLSGNDRATTYLTKPFLPSELVKRVRQMATARH